MPSTRASGVEADRLARADSGAEAWRDWGPYLAERAWGTVREDYSADGDAWAFFPHDHARSRAYRWNDDGMAGFCDLDQTWCLALGLWNGVDPILKERMFGLAGPDGNHGEDVKEYWWYRDATPTHSWNSWRYHYPQRAFPYDDLLTTNAARDRSQPEYELVDTGAFDDSRYWVVSVDYAKAGIHDLLMSITVENAGPEAATLHVLPTLWYRNTWSWGDTDDPRPKPQLVADGARVIGRTGADAPQLVFAGDGAPDLLFCDNETNTARVFGATGGPRFPKDGINDAVVSGAATVNPDRVGTKAALHYTVTVAPGESAVIRVRLRQVDARARGERPAPPLDAVSVDAESSDAESFDTVSFDTVVATRRSEADAFYASLSSEEISAERSNIMRQAFAGLLWCKQFFHFNVHQWLIGDPALPPPPDARLSGRNAAWPQLDAHDVILMPDSWEYPWFASWDLAFHCVTLAHIDPAFAKAQLILILREWYMHPTGQLPAYEWNFSDVNPPTHAWAALKVFQIDGGTDTDFLARVFHKLLMNFTWWTNNKDRGDDNLFEGGFMGLDNIAPIDRSTLPLSVGTIEQADTTAWMAMFALNMLEIALILAQKDAAYEDTATTFVEHFLRIAAAANDNGLWNEEDGYFFDVLHLADGEDIPLKVHSLVGLVPLAASLVVPDSETDALPAFRARLRWFLDHHPEFRDSVSSNSSGSESRTLFTLVPQNRLTRILGRLFDEQGLLSPHGVRSISAQHREQPFSVTVAGQTFAVDYEPGESTTALFGGNSNWRGPVWFPLNLLLVEALDSYDAANATGLTVPFPTGSATQVRLGSAASALAERLISLFCRVDGAPRPADARYPLLSTDQRWSDNLFFYEYFHGDTGEGLGASHQTGWTAVVAHLILTADGAAKRER